jgi:tyrosine-specific transport protein
MHSRMIGGILLIVGTSIGAGMLALPVANAAAGFWASSVFLLICWALMTAGAFFILEVNLYLPRGKHMVSMANATTGVPGLVVTWLSYLLLLYSLLSAYISGGADVMGGLLQHLHIQAPMWLLSSLFTLLFGLIVYCGIRQVDLVNRGLMFAKLSIYAILVVFIAPHVEWSYLQQGSAPKIMGSLMILMTSFGFAIIVPNLRDYFDDDIQQLKKVVWIGSLIPLLCYCAWDAVIIGALPSQGSEGLIALLQSDHTTSTLAMTLSNTVDNRLISSLFNVFTSICMLTAFLGVSLCLLSFLGDGLSMVQSGKQGFLLFVLTFLPPLILVLFYPGAYIHALNYAGYLCVVLLLFLPALMSYCGRKHFQPRFIVPGGKATQWLVMLFAVVLMGVAIRYR